MRTIQNCLKITKKLQKINAKVGATNEQIKQTKRLNKSIPEKYALIQCWTALFSFNNHSQLQLIIIIIINLLSFSIETHSHKRIIINYNLKSLSITIYNQSQLT